MVQQPIVDVTGYLSDELGGVALKIVHIVLADGTKIRVEGEHDFPYITDSNNPRLNELVLDEECIERLHSEESDERGNR